MIAPLFAAFFLNPTAQAGAVASHFKAETRLGANYWNAAAAIDGKMETCWMVPGESPNRGESVTIDIPKGEVDKIGMVIGWAKDDTTFGDYARVKEIRVEAFSYNEDRELVTVGSANASFEDKPGWQVVDVTNFAVGTEEAGGKVKITIVDIFPGKDFPNLGISEMLVYLKEMDNTPKVDTASGEDSGHGKDLMSDANPKTFWSGPAEGATLTLSTAGFGLSRIGITAGSKDYARPKKVQITVGGRTGTGELPDAPGVQWVDVPAMNGYSGSAWGEIEVKILETYPGAKMAGSVAISELTAKATTYEGL